MPGTGTAPGAWRGRGLNEGFGATERIDAWWAKPAAQGVLALIALGYAGWAGFTTANTVFAPYHSPFHVHLFTFKPWWILSPALISLGVPVLFRATCYYFRRAYYRSFFGDPPACAVGELRRKYSGEQKFPFVLQNLHRYFLYLALLFLIVHWVNTAHAYVFDGRFGIGLGSLLLTLDATLLSFYTLSCHAFRHMVGGNVNCFSCAQAGGARRKTWSAVSLINGHHMGYFWWSLYTICFADLYVRLCATGAWHDPRLF